MLSPLGMENCQKRPPLLEVWFQGYLGTFVFSTVSVKLLAQQVNCASKKQRKNFGPCVKNHSGVGGGQDYQMWSSPGFYCICVSKIAPQVGVKFHI